MGMLSHLADFKPLASATPAEILAAQVNTAAPANGDWLAALGAPSDAAAAASAASALAQSAFATLTNGSSAAEQRDALLEVKTPEAVQKILGMLTAYDWEFVTKAQEMRSYAVSKLMEETAHPDARIRLRALELLGRVTEVALFTDRVEIKKTQMDDTELNAKIEEKLRKFMHALPDAVVIDPNAEADK